MASLKSERLKKLEAELNDLIQWKNLGLVPKKDLDKHQEEIRQLQEKIVEEKEKLRFMKESGEVEEYVAPKRNASRQAYPDTHTLPDMDIGVDNMTEAGIDMEAEPFEVETSVGEETEFHPTDDATMTEDDEDPFSDRNRWKRGIMEDPDADKW